MFVADDLAAWLADTLVDSLLSLARRKAALGLTILGFSAAGVGLIIGSYFVSTWWQALLLALGTSLIIVGTVEVGILGVLRKIIDPDEEPSEMVKALDAWLNRPDTPLAAPISNDWGESSRSGSSPTRAG